MTLIKKVLQSKITSIVCIFVALINIFLFGSFSNDFVLEENASDISELVKNNETEYATISVFNNGNSPQTLPVSSEFYSMYSIFNINENKCTFAATGNANKNHDIQIKDISNSEKNYSILYADYNRNKEYNGHWKHDFYPLELMFRGENSRSGDAYSFCYVSQTDANTIMSLRGIDNYESLIGTNIRVVVDSTEYLYTIGNIYYEQNYFYQGLAETIGDFIFTYTTFPVGVKKENTYFLNSFQYQNKYYLNRIISKYDKNSFDVELNTFNLKKYDRDRLLRFFYHNDTSFNWVFVFSIILSSLLLFYSLAWAWFFFSPKNKIDLVIIVITLCLPYLLARLSFEMSKSILFFSYSSTVVNLIFIAVILATLAIFAFVKEHRKKIVRNNSYYEKIDI